MKSRPTYRTANLTNFIEPPWGQECEQRCLRSWSRGRVTASTPRADAKMFWFYLHLSASRKLSAKLWGEQVSEGCREWVPAWLLVVRSGYTSCGDRRRVYSRVFYSRIGPGGCPLPYRQQGPEVVR